MSTFSSNLWGKPFSHDGVFWVGPLLNIVIPMAGRGSRFAQVGYPQPKPLIPVHGMPMIEVVVRNIRPGVPHRFIFVVLEDHLRDLDLARTLHRIAPGCAIVPTAGVTEGAACTVLLARAFIADDFPLLLANSDQWVQASMEAFVNRLMEPAVDGLIMTMNADDPKWSFVKLNEAGWVMEVAEKRVISHHATVGIYGFRRGHDFVRAAERMIQKNLRVNNEFYVAPVYNEMAAEGAKVGVFNVGRDRDGMYGLGTPADLENFLGLPVSQEAVGRVGRDDGN